MSFGSDTESLKRLCRLGKYGVSDYKAGLISAQILHRSGTNIVSYMHWQNVPNA